jgi:hypothetical protein
MSASERYHDFLQRKVQFDTPSGIESPGPINLESE